MPILLSVTHTRLTPSRTPHGRLVLTPSTDTHHTPIPPPDTAALQTMALGALAIPGAKYVRAHVRFATERAYSRSGSSARESRSRMERASPGVRSMNPFDSSFRII